jgi:hypothetical protein
MKITEEKDLVTIEIHKEDFARTAKGLNFLNYATAAYLKKNSFAVDDYFVSVIDFISEVSNFFIDRK